MGPEGSGSGCWRDSPDGICPRRSRRTPGAECTWLKVRGSLCLGGPGDPSSAVERSSGFPLPGRTRGSQLSSGKENWPHRMEDACGGLPGVREGAGVAGNRVTRIRDVEWVGKMGRRGLVHDI